MKLREFVRVPRLSHCVRFVDQISKDEDRTPLLTVGILFIFTHLSCVHLATFKIHSISQTPPNFEQKTSPEVVNNSRNQATSTSLARTPFLFASDRGCQFSACVYWAVWGFTVRKKWVIMGRLGPSGFSVTEWGHNMDWWPSHANLCTHPESSLESKFFADCTRLSAKVPRGHTHAEPELEKLVGHSKLLCLQDLFFFLFFLIIFNFTEEEEAPQSLLDLVDYGKTKITQLALKDQMTERGFN